MAYANKVAGTEPKENQKNPPDAKPDDWRNPWKGAAIGGTLGGLVTTALGYLYGHRGRWLAYDAIAGGGTGAAIGYGVDAHNNAKAMENIKDQAASGPSKEAAKIRAQRREQEQLLDHQAAVAERRDTNARGGYFRISDDIKNLFRGGHVPDNDKWKQEKKQIQWGLVGR